MAPDSRPIPGSPTAPSVKDNAAEPSVFTRILDNELPGHFVWREPDVAAFMTVGPLQPGHVLVVTTAQIDHWLDVPAEVWARVNAVSRHIGMAQMDVFRPRRIATIVAGLEVPHCHLHVVPIRSESDLSFANARTNVPQSELAEHARRLRAHLVESGHPEAAL